MKQRDVARMALGDVEDGTARLHRALEIARTNDDMDGLAYAYANLAAQMVGGPSAV